MIKIRRLLLSLITLILISTLLVACSNSDTDNAMPTPEDFAKLDARVLGRWDAMINRDFELAYSYLSPSYRKLFPLRHYLSSTGTSVRWLSVNIKDSKYADTRAEVVLDLDYQLDFPMGAGDDFGTMTDELKEIWLWVDGQWWYVDEDDGTPG